MSDLYSIKFKDIWSYLKTQDSLFWLINIYLFLEYVRPQTLYPVLDVFPYAMTVLILSVVMLIVNSNYSLVPNGINKLIILFFIIIVLSSIFALSPEVAYPKLYEFISWMIVYFLIINIINTENRFLVFLLGFLLYSFKMSQYSFQGWVAHGFSFVKDGSGGGPGWFKNSGEFGIQMCIFLPLSGCFWFVLKEYWPTWKKFFFFLFPLTALTGTVSSSSRGAVLGAGAVLIFMLMKGKNKIRSLLILVCIAGFIYILIPDRQLDRFRSSGEDSTSTTRLNMWGRGIELASRFPVLGVGYKNWGIAQQQVFGISNQLLPHNIFIECASELGYTGLSVFVLMIISTFWNNFQSRKIALSVGIITKANARFVYYLAHGLDGALIGYLVSGFFVTVLYYPYFWINLAMTVALNSIAGRRLIQNDTACQ